MSVMIMIDGNVKCNRKFGSILQGWFSLTTESESEA